MLGRLSPASRRLEGRLMASINRSLKVGGSDGVECHRALPAQRGRKGGGDADERAPRRSERGRGWKSADRQALLHSKRGKGESARADRGGVGRATGRHRAACALRARSGVLGHQRPKARGERGQKTGPGFGAGPDLV